MKRFSPNFKPHPNAGDAGSEVIRRAGSDGTQPGSSVYLRTGVVLLSTLFLCSSGCVQRQLTVQTDPEGAVVYLNDREMGRTPFTHEFLWYGNYDVVVRKDDCKTLKTIAVVNAPFWQLVPFDAITDFLPLVDHHTVSFKLDPDAPGDPKILIQRGLEMQQDLESSQHTVRHSVLNVHASPTPAATTQSTQPTTARDIR